MPELLITLAAGAAGYLLARRFVSRRLRFVDAVQSRLAPFVTAVIAGIIAWPLTLLPLVTLSAAIFFGIGAGFGAARGARIVRRADWELKRMTS